MGNTDSSPMNDDRPLPLALEAKSLAERGFFEAAAKKYRRSYDLYKESGAMASAGRSLRLAVETGLQMTVIDYEVAAGAFEEVGSLYLTNMITAVKAKEAHANSIFALLAAGRIATAKGKYADFVKKDERFANSGEGLTAKMIMEAYQNGSKSQVTDCFDAFKDVDGAMPTWKESMIAKIIERL